MGGRSTNALVEAEDARLSGNLRSLARRVKGLNVTQARPTDSLLQAETLPTGYFAERRTGAAGQGGVSGAARPRGVKGASGIVSQTRVA